MKDKILKLKGPLLFYFLQIKNIQKDNQDTSVFCKRKSYDHMTHYFHISFYKPISSL